MDFSDTPLLGPDSTLIEFSRLLHEIRFKKLIDNSDIMEFISTMRPSSVSCFVLSHLLRSLDCECSRLSSGLPEGGSS